jgi:hypothetical protein
VCVCVCVCVQGEEAPAVQLVMHEKVTTSLMEELSAAQGPE